MSSPPPSGKRRIEESPESSSKRSKKSSHLAECNDEDCPGCAEGELDVHFAVLNDSNEPGEEVDLSGQALLRVALAEREKYVAMDEDEAKEDEEVRVIRLFELAIEKLRTEESEESNDKQDTSLENSSRRLLGVALRELGGFVGFDEHAVEATEIFETLAQSFPASDVYMGLGKCLVLQIRLMVKDEALDKDEIKKVTELFGNAHDAFDNALKSLSGGALTRHASSAARDLRDVCQLLTSQNSDTSSIVDDASQNALKYVQMIQEEDLEGTLDALNAELTLFSSKLNLQQLNLCINKLKHACEKAKLAELSISIQVERMVLLAEALLMRASREDVDEEQCLESHENAVALLKECIKLDPDNDTLQERLEEIEEIEPTGDVSE